MATTFPQDKQDLALAKAATLDEKVDYHDDSADDTIIPGSEGVTVHEYATLRRVADRLPYTAWLVVVVEFAERYAPSVQIFIDFLFLSLLQMVLLWHHQLLQQLYPCTSSRRVYHWCCPSIEQGRRCCRCPWPGSPEVVRHSDGELWSGVMCHCSYILVQFNTFWIYVTPWLGGILADTLLGRYYTIMIFSFVCLYVVPVPIFTMFIAYRCCNLSASAILSLLHQLHLLLYSILRQLWVFSSWLSLSWV